MNILFIGDIVGKTGREVVINNLFSISKAYNIDLVIANGENSAHGKGITLKIYNQLIKAGIDVITLGNHAFSKNDIFLNIDYMDKLVCPINHDKKPNEALEYVIVNKNNKRICITNILGQAMMNETSFSPYEAMNMILNETKNKADAYFVDFHAEATAEKRLFCEIYKDKIFACVGTHTHVQTADEQIIDGCAFISDVGMCGPNKSIIGRDIEECYKTYVLNEKTTYTISEGNPILSAVVICLNDDTMRAESIKRIRDIY